MADRVFDRETLLDVSVNVVPILILLFFVVLFLVVNPWPPDLFAQAITHGLTIIPLFLLAVLTYFAARVL